MTDGHTTDDEEKAGNKISGGGYEDEEEIISNVIPTFDIRAHWASFLSLLSTRTP